MFLAMSIQPPYFLLTASATSVTINQFVGVGRVWITAWNSNMSWPAPAEASAAMRAAGRWC